MIEPASGERIAAEEIERHYCRSLFIKEICVLRLADSAGAERAFAVIVPDFDRLRAKRIVNVGDIIRFEMEGLTAQLPVRQRVFDYDIWFEPLPRMTADAIDRAVVEQRARERREIASGSRAAPISAADQEWMALPHSVAMLAIIRRRQRTSAGVVPGANLEIDLGFDSMDRVELLAELEQRSGVKVPLDIAAGILTVRQLVDAMTAERVGSFAIEAAEQSWAPLLRDRRPAIPFLAACSTGGRSPRR